MKYTLMNGDCIELMKKIPDESIDLLVTDCPYRLVGGGCTGKEAIGGILSLDMESVRKGTVFKHNNIYFSSWLPEAFRVMKPKTHTYIMVNGRNLADLQSIAELAGFQFVNLLVWAKNNVTINRYYMNRTEFILMLRKGGAKTINNVGTPNVLTVPNIIGKKVHPTQKPVELMEILINNSSEEGETVLDMFMGSGSTGVACVNTNRDFIGMELDHIYYDIARERIAEAHAEKGREMYLETNQISMFDLLEGE